MGSEAKSVEVIFDNASDWLIVEGSECANCEGTTYDINTSNVANSVTQVLSERTYGVATM